jgi:hypothetical protein
MCVAKDHHMKDRQAERLRHRQEATPSAVSSFSDGAAPMIELPGDNGVELAAAGACEVAPGTLRRAKDSLERRSD